MHHRLTQAALIAVLSLSSMAMAQDEGERKPDARLYGYEVGDDARKVELKYETTSTAWFILSGLGVLCIGVMFKNARRTHLD